MTMIYVRRDLTPTEFRETHPWLIARAADRRKRAWWRVARRLIVFGLATSALAIIAVAPWPRLFL